MVACAGGCPHTSRYQRERPDTSREPHETDGGVQHAKVAQRHIAGFANPRAAEDKGPPARVPTPKVYDYNSDEKPIIPEAERPHLRREGDVERHGRLPTPPVYDFNGRQGLTPPAGRRCAGGPAVRAGKALGDRPDGVSGRALKGDGVDHLW